MSIIQTNGSGVTSNSTNNNGNTIISATISSSNPDVGFVGSIVVSNNDVTKIDPAKDLAHLGLSYGVYGNINSGLSKIKTITTVRTNTAINKNQFNAFSGKFKAPPVVSKDFIIPEEKLPRLPQHNPVIINVGGTEIIIIPPPNGSLNPVDFGVQRCTEPLVFKTRTINWNSLTDGQQDYWLKNHPGQEHPNTFVDGYCDGDCGDKCEKICHYVESSKSFPFCHCDCDIDDIFTCGENPVKVSECIGPKRKIGYETGMLHHPENGSVRICDCKDPWVCDDFGNCLCQFELDGGICPTYFVFDTNTCTCIPENPDCDLEDCQSGYIPGEINIEDCSCACSDAGDIIEIYDGFGNIIGCDCSDSAKALLATLKGMWTLEKQFCDPICKSPLITIFLDENSDPACCPPGHYWNNINMSCMPTGLCCPDPTTDVYYPEISACCQEGAVTFPKPGTSFCWEGPDYPGSESAYVTLVECVE